MRILVKFLSRFFTNQEDLERIRRVVIPSFFVHGVAGLLGLALIFVMTKGLGAKEYGIYTYAVTVSTLLATFGISGLNAMAVRETSSLIAKNEMGLWRGLRKWSIKNGILIGCVTAALSAAFLAIFTYSIPLFKETPYTLPLICAFGSIPFLSLMNLYSYFLLGQHKTVVALLADNIIKPFLLLIILVGGIFFIKNISGIHAIFFLIAAIAGGLIFAFAVFVKNSNLTDAQPQYDKKRWKGLYWSFFMLSAISNINLRIDVLMLGFLTDASLVGIYSAADRVAAGLYVFMAIMNQISAASMSRLHTTSQPEKLQVMITKITRWVTVLSAPVFIGVIIFSKWILHYFGEGFEEGQTALIIICISQLVSIMIGPVTNLSIMTGNEKLNLILSFIRLLLGILLNIWLIPYMGITGAAIASAVITILWNIAMLIAVKKKTGISAWIFG